MVNLQVARKSIRKFFSFDVKKLIPILQWLPLYGFSKLRSDVIAGIAVSLLVIPHALAHAIIAGLDPQTGLYTSFPAMFVYVFVGSSKDMNMGTTVITALLANRFSITEDPNPEIAAALAFLVGVVLIVIAVLRLGFLVRLLSFPVISAFVSASAVLLIIIQIVFILGIKKAPRATYLKIKHIFTNIKYTKAPDVTLGICCIIVLCLLQKMASRKRHQNASRCRKIIRDIAMVVGIGRNAAVALIAILIVYVSYVIKADNIFITVGSIPPGLPKLKMPLRPIKIDANRTLEVKDLVRGFGSGLGIIPVIVIIQAIAITKSLARKNRYKVDPSQEIIASGLANVFVSLFSGFPVTASFGRSAINSLSGAKTCISGVIASSIVVIVIEFLGPLFRFLPYSALAAMSMLAAINIFDYKLAKRLWHVNKVDFVVWIVTFFGCLYEFDVGIIVGVVLSAIIVFYRVFNPRLDIDIDKETKTLTIALKGGIWFPGIEAVSDKLAEIIDKEGSAINVVVVDCKNMLEIDFTVVHGLNQIIYDCMLTKIQVRFINVDNKKIKKHFEEAGLLENKPVLPNEETEDTNGHAELLGEDSLKVFETAC